MNNKNFSEKHNEYFLRGEVTIHRKNNETGEIVFVERSSNIIPISGMQFVLMKCFGLYLDSSHMKDYEEIGKDTNLVIPDLNGSKMNIGTFPENYSIMESDISENHFIQGFMVGTGGTGEDAITTKNTDYSFMNLRHAIPFQQTQTRLNSSISGKYLGELQNPSAHQSEAGTYSHSYYIKKFDERPHIYHSWWRDGQRWDYVDPITPSDLGPDGNGLGKTNRIETYVECKLSIDESDCIAYFSHTNISSQSTAVLNELGLVAFDTVPGSRSIIENLYSNYIKQFLMHLYEYDDDNDLSEDDKITRDDILIKEATSILEVLNTFNISSYNQSNINEFMSTLEEIAGETKGSIVFSVYQNKFNSEDNITVESFYNHNHVLVYTTDKFLEYLSSYSFDDLTVDEAQRIKLVTYYTFNPIPLQENWSILINYRIYAN